MAKEKRTEKKETDESKLFPVATHSPKMCGRLRKQNTKNKTRNQLLLLFESIGVNLDVAQIQKSVLLGTARILRRVLTTTVARCDL